MEGLEGLHSMAGDHGSARVVVTIPEATFTVCYRVTLQSAELLCSIALS